MVAETEKNYFKIINIKEYNQKSFELTNKYQEELNNFKNRFFKIIDSINIEDVNLLKDFFDVYVKEMNRIEEKFKQNFENLEKEFTKNDNPEIVGNKDQIENIKNENETENITETTNQVESIEPVESFESFEPFELFKLFELFESIEPTESTESTEPIEPIQKINKIKNIDKMFKILNQM